MDTFFPFFSIRLLLTKSRIQLKKQIVQHKSEATATNTQTLKKMTLLTLILMISAIALSSFNYLKVLYEAKRKIKIVTVETVKAANGQQKQQFTVNEYAQAPGPSYILPIIGNLVELGKYAAPSIAFTELAKKYGDIYSMTLGSTRCLVINNLDLIREVLNHNGKSFGARPDFMRFHKLFGGDRGNCKFTFY